MAHEREHLRWTEDDGVAVARHVENLLHLTDRFLPSPLLPGGQRDLLQSLRTRAQRVVQDLLKIPFSADRECLRLQATIRAELDGIARDIEELQGILQKPPHKLRVFRDDETAA